MIENLKAILESDPTSKRIAIRDFTNSFDELLANATEVELRGRLVNVRKFKAISFAVIEDQSGRTQLVFSDNATPNHKELIKNVSMGDIVKVNGLPFLPQSNEKSLAVNTVETVAKFQDLQPDKHKGIVDTGKRRKNFALQLISDRESFEFFASASELATNMRDNLNLLGFKEFETPVLRKQFFAGQAKPFSSFQNSLNTDVYMRPTSELELVQLVASGYERVYELGKAFRNEGQDRLHNPEYTTVEAYAAYTDYNQMMNLVEVLVYEAGIKAFDRTEFQYQDKIINLTEKWQRLTVDDSFQKFAGFSLSDIRDDESLSRVAAQNNVNVDGMTHTQALGKMIEKIIVPQLIQPTFLKDFPIELAPLGKQKEGDPNIVERAWACIGGVAFSDISTNLVDPEELIKRLIAQDQENGKQVDHSNDPLVVALRYGIPPTGGIGIGLNRLLMVLGNRNHISETFIFPDL